MAEALWLIRRTTQGFNDDRNRVREVLINIDDGDDDATKIQGTIDALNAATPTGDGLPAHDVAGENVYPDFYFDEVINIDDLSGTGEDNLRTEFDFIAYGSEVTAVKTPLV